MRVIDIFQQRQRSAFARQFRGIRPGDRGAVARHVHARHAAAAGGVAARCPVPVTRVEFEFAAGKAGQLGFGTQCQPVGQGIAFDRVRACALAIGQPRHAFLALHRYRPHAATQRHAMRAQPRHVIQPLGQQAGCTQHARHGGTAVGRARRVQHRRHLRTGLGILIRHQIQQRARAQEDDARADGAALVLLGHLRSAQGVDAWGQPTGKGQHSVGGARGQDQVRVRLPGR
ncbi:hypothetical protein G6F57_018300 [Rhizopus arrhizus]|nr:hypothetical protein G6F57_018300 [Rhizopus arrhizus]